MRPDGCDPVQALLTRLDDPRPTGRDRWRAACPVCGGRNRSTLSVGVGDTGAVLLRCWKSGCGAEQVAHALGLNVEDLFPERHSHAGAPARRRLIGAAQALDLLEAEITLTIVCLSDMARGDALDVAMRERLLLAAARVSMLRDEVRS